MAEAMLTEEVVITSCKSSIQVWNALHSEKLNCIHSYKNIKDVAPNSLNVIKDQLLLIAEKGKPLLHFWQINNTDEIETPKLLLPEVANVIQISHDNNYLAAATNKMLYIWQVNCGVLLTAQQVHPSVITCITFSKDTHYVLIGTEDGSVLVNHFMHLLNLSQYTDDKLGQIIQIHNFQHHTKAVTGIQIDLERFGQHFITSSLDNSCFLYNLFSGETLMHLTCDQSIMSIKVDTTFGNVYIGSSTGNIIKCPLTTSTKTKVHVSTIESHFSGHTDCINCLDLNISSTLLVSGSDDFTVIVWNTENKQIINKLKMTSAATNVKFIFTTNIFNSNFYPTITLSELQLTLDRNSCTKYKSYMYSDFVDLLANIFEDFQVLDYLFQKSE